MKKIFRISLLLFAIVILLAAIPPLILAYPDFLLGEKFTHKNFTVLSDHKVDEKMEGVLDSVSNTLSRTGFHTKKPIKIILCEGRLATLFEKLSLAPGGAGFHHFSGNLYLFTERITQFRKENAKATGEEKRLLKYSYQEFAFEKILTHEILHKLHSDTLGIWSFRRKMPPPHWKAEGFAEYYAFYEERREDEDYDFKDRTRLYLTYRDKFPLFYYRSELLYEFLAEHQHLSFPEIMQDTITEQATFDAWMKWYDLKH